MSNPYYADDTVTIHHGDCLDVLATLPDASVDAVVTDPPYGLEFMGKEWDQFDGREAGKIQTDTWGKATTAIPGSAYASTLPRFTGKQGASLKPFQDWCELWATECLRVLKPGGHLLAFGGTRTSHRLASAIEDAGFEIRDSIAWLYGSGFPKSLDVSKAIDKARGDNAAWRAVGAWLREARTSSGMSAKALCAAIGAHGEVNHGGAVANWEGGLSCPTWDQWQAMQRALAFGGEMDAEVWRLNGRKGLPGDAWDQREVVGKGSAGLGGGSNGAAHEGGFGLDYNLTAPATDAARTWQGWGTALKPAHEPVVVARKPLVGTVAGNVLAHGTGALNIDGCRYQKSGERWDKRPNEDIPHAGRWPANVVLDESQATALDQQSGELPSSRPGSFQREMTSRGYKGGGLGQRRAGDHDATEITKPGYEGAGGASRFFYTAKADAAERVRVDGTAHPTVKPLALMQWLVRLVTPPDGIVLEPFAGSGTTVEACILEGFKCIAIEREADYLPLITQRIHRRRDPVAAVLATAEDGGLFDLLGEEPA